MSPIVLFVYRRPDHTHRVLESLASNPEAIESELIVFADMPDTTKPYDSRIAEDVLRVCIVAQSFLGRFKSVEWHLAESHLGLAESTRAGLTNVFSRYDTAIVLEDDVLVSRDFLKFMNEGLEYHRKTDYIFSLTGFCPKIDTSFYTPFSTFLYPRFWTLGWATWKDRFDSIDWKVKNPEPFTGHGGADRNAMLARVLAGDADAFAIKIAYSARNRYTLFPSASKTQAIGLDGSGTNCHGNLHPSYFVEISEQPLRHSPTFPLDKISEQIDAMFRQSIIQKIINYVRYGVKP